MFHGIVLTFSYHSCSATKKMCYKFMYTLCSEQFLSCKSGVSNLYVHASHTVKCNMWTTQVLQLSESCKITEIYCSVICPLFIKHC